MTAAEIHAAGLSQVARIEARYQADVMDPLGHPGSFAEFVEKVCKDPTGGQYYQTREALLADYRTLCDQIYDVLPRYFETIPDAKLEIVEKHSETAPAAYYMQGTADGARPGRFYVCGKPSTLVWRPIFSRISRAFYSSTPHHCAMRSTRVSVAIAR